MKAFSKLGLLLALIIVGRYLRLTEPAISAGQAQAAYVSKVDTLRFASYATNKAAFPITPVNQRHQATNQPSEPAYLVWY